FLAADALYTVGFMAAVGQTPGQMAMGIHVVDRRSGAPATWTQIGVRWLVSALLRQGPKLLLPPPPAADGERRRALQADVKKLELEHGDDPQRLNQALLDRYGRFAGRPARLVRVALSLLAGSADHLVMLGDPLRRCLHDRAAGTIVVEAARRPR
ncbi:MAG: hypothetical protein QOG43_2529, partial [Actinomycetota bacterium]|nr:hypothetical protein [Actinomycetota bacterium]